MFCRKLQGIGDHGRGTRTANEIAVIANVRFRLLAFSVGLVALGASIACSSSSSAQSLCPAASAIGQGVACNEEAIVCPYVDDQFDSNRSFTTSDCFGNDFIEYTCTQKQWVVTAQAATVCALDTNGVLTSPSTCALGVGRCAVAAGTVACVSSGCYEGEDAGYSGVCVSGRFVVTPTSCNGSPLDAGDDGQAGDAATTDDAAATEDASSDAGDD
jgi:hypothetical protein